MRTSENAGGLVKSPHCWSGCLVKKKVKGKLWLNVLGEDSGLYTVSPLCRQEGLVYFGQHCVFAQYFITVKIHGKSSQPI